MRDTYMISTQTPVCVTPWSSCTMGLVIAWHPGKNARIKPGLPSFWLEFWREQVMDHRQTGWAALGIMSLNVDGIGSKQCLFPLRPFTLIYRACMPWHVTAWLANCHLGRPDHAVWQEVGEIYFLSSGIFTHDPLPVFLLHCQLRIISIPHCPKF